MLVRLLSTISSYAVDVCWLAKMTCRPRVRINRKHDAQELFRDLETNLNLLKRLPEFRTPAVVRVTEEALECAREILTWAPQYDHDYEG